MQASTPKSDLEKWKDQHKLACQKDWLSWMANCSQDAPGIDGGHPELPVEVSKGYAGVSGGGFDASASYGQEGLQTDYAVPVAPGASVGTKGVTYTVGADEKVVPKAYAGLCVKWKGSKEEKRGPKVEGEASGGIFQGSWDGHELCGGLQTPAPPDVSVSMKP
jgi:hypothetical protein